MNSKSPDHDSNGSANQPAPRIGEARWGSFNRLRPFSSLWGTDRGRPVDRYYIESFLEKHRSDFKGRCLEVENANYLTKYGGDAVEALDVIDVAFTNNQATLVADLSTGNGVPQDAFDCFIMTQTLQFIFDCQAAVRNAHKLLRPRGVLLATVPGITPSPFRDPYTVACCWSFTKTSLEKMFGDVFGAENIEVMSHGNVRVATAFLWGMSLEELSTDDYDDFDPDYPVILTIRAKKNRPSREVESAQGSGF